ncbi:expressed conserved protein [Echinococcus multilocularis]|uniref:Expressed conserved protein n=1 Tax=Echinococcus multilocularis TaxID=6211 RepID=A0A068YJA3_ECHMU|nr:expressed conserved protein [Echinococcus multilocularis]
MLLLFVLIAFLHIHESSLQALSVSLNPGCFNCSEENISVVSVVYRGRNSSIHFIVSITNERSVPSVFLAYSNANSSVQFDWPAIIANNKSTQAVDLVDSSFYGLLFPNLYQYEDRADVADISRATGRIVKFPLDQCFWFLSHWDSVPNASTGLLSLALRCNDSSPSVLFANKGFIELRFTFSERDRFADSAPRTLLLGGLAVRMKVTLRRLALRWKETRWALNLAVVANRSLPDTAAFENFISASIDDEPSPGAFRDMTIFLSNHSYVTWKSVCYIDETATNLKSIRAIGVSTQWRVDKATNRSLTTSSLLPFVYGPTEDSIAVRLLNVSFGDTGDGFYRSSNYIDWTLTFALGTPPPKHYSPLIWMMLFLSITVVSAALCVLVYVIGYHVLRRRVNSYEEPLLEEVEDLDNQSA